MGAAMLNRRRIPEQKPNINRVLWNRTKPEQFPARLSDGLEISINPSLPEGAAFGANVDISIVGDALG